jgi:hypothetical protein
MRATRQVGLSAGANVGMRHMMAAGVKAGPVGLVWSLASSVPKFRAGRRIVAVAKRANALGIRPSMMSDGDTEQTRRTKRMIAKEMATNFSSMLLAKSNDREDGQDV